MSEDTTMAIKRLERMMERLWHTVTLDKDRTWSTSDVAAYLDVSETQVQTLVKTNKSFPSARRYNVGKAKSNPRWVRDEIKDWFRAEEDARPARIINKDEQLIYDDMEEDRLYRENIAKANALCGPEIPESVSLIRKYHLMPPDGGLHQLYRHYSLSGDLLYVGISNSVMHRLAGHKRTSHWYKDIANVNIENFPSREALKLAEDLAIKTEYPEHNIMLREVS